MATPCSPPRRPAASRSTSTTTVRSWPSPRERHHPGRVDREDGAGDDRPPGPAALRQPRPRAVILGAELDTLAAAHPDRFSLVHHLDADRGLVTDATIAAFLAEELDVAIYLCGPTPFMDVVETTLASSATTPPSCAPSGS
ncbi:MAG: hypothetical protein R2695_18485 [Acidimicrobiales bacterium]